MISYYINESKKIIRELIIENFSDEAKLCKVVSNKGIYKLIIIEKNSKDTIMIDDSNLDIIEVGEVIKNDIN